MTADQLPPTKPSTALPHPEPDRASPFGSVKPTAPHWPGRAERPGGAAAGRPADPDRMPN